MNLLYLIATLLISQFGRNEGASCSSYTDYDSCGQNNLCTWVYTASIDDGSCNCASAVALEILFVMDISGSVGESAWQTEAKFVEDLIESGVNNESYVGVMTFGTGAWSFWNFTDPQHPRSDIIEMVDNITYTGGKTYMKTAVTAGITIFENTGSADYDNLMFLITDGDPSPSKYQTVCKNNKIKDDLDDAGITVVVIGVGSGWSESSISCLVDDEDSQIIPVENFSDDDFASVRQYTDSFSCPATISLVLSEVRVSDKSTGSLTDSRFVEFYNDGVTIGLDVNPLILTGIVEGTITESTIANITADKYIVFYDTDTTNDPNCYLCEACTSTVTAGFCDDAIYIPCDSGNTYECSFSSSVTNTDWSQTVQDGSDNSYIINVTVAGGGTWPSVADGFTFENSDLTASDNIGSNWAQSCYQYGTAGDAPIEDCTGDCDEDACQAQGDTAATCSTGTTGTCICTTASGYYRAGSSCYYLDGPESCSTSTFKESDSGAFQTAYISWDSVSTESGYITYQVTYLEDGSTTTLSTTALFQYAYNTYEFDAYTSATTEPKVRVKLNLNDTIMYSSYTTCPISTSAPSQAPTNAPTYAVPLIDTCTVTLQPQSTDLYVEWTEADTSIANTDPTIYGYYIFYHDYTGTGDLQVVDSIGGAATSYDGLSLAGSIVSPFDSGDLVMNISAILYDGYDENIDEARMKLYATDCTLVTPAPTASPTDEPTREPTPSPIPHPTGFPTQAPTYALWNLTDCSGTIDYSSQKFLTLTWSQNNPGSTRTLYLRRTIYGTSTEENQKLFVSQSAETATQYIQDDITGLDARDTWEIYVLAVDRADGDEFEQGTTICDVTSAAPTTAPTNQPSNDPSRAPTNQPSMDPSRAPTNLPTASPTYSPFTIDDCEYTVGKSDLRFTATFTEPNYDPNGEWRPTAEEVRYIFEYTDDSNIVNTDDTWTGQSSNGTFEEDILLDDGIDIDEPVYVMAVYDGDHDIILAAQALCVPNTQAPTLSPTTPSPTPAPTWESPSVKIDINSIESDPACSNDTATGEWECTLPESNTATEIEFLRLPLEYGEEVTVEWQISSDGFSSSSRRRRRTLFKGNMGFDKLNLANLGRHVRKLLQTGSTGTDWVTEEDFDGDISGTDDIGGSSEVGANVGKAEITIKQEEETGEGTERFYFELTSCESTGEYVCTLVDPYRVLIYVEDTGDNLTTASTLGDLPTWIWYPIAAGVLLLPIMGWLGWRFYNKKKLAEQMEQQRKQELNDQLALDDAGNFGEIGDAVQFNPLATGGTADIATGGDFIQKELDAQKANFEVAHVDIETNVFRQDFGPVQTNSRV